MSKKSDAKKAAVLGSSKKSKAPLFITLAVAFIAAGAGIYLVTGGGTVDQGPAAATAVAATQSTAGEFTYPVSSFDDGKARFYSYKTNDGIDIRYYSIIYNLVDDIKAVLSGLLAPQQREKFLGYAEIREVFNITKVGKVAGCMVTDGLVKRGSKVRLLRDNVVIHDGALKTLRRFKDEVREVKDGYECGMAFENYQDIQVGDQIECYEVEEVARAL